MTMPKKLQVIELEQGLTIIKKAFTKMKNLVEGIPEQPFNSEEVVQVYTTIYNMCIQKEPHNYSRPLYVMYKEILEEYITTIFLPALSKNHDEYMLRELVKRWGSYKILVKWLSHFFSYLDRWFIPRKLLPTLHEVNLACFRDQVYVGIKSSLTAAVITLIDREREGGEIDRDLLKNVLEICVVIGMGTMDAYENGFELAVLTETASYYSRKAASWIEEDSFPDYMFKAQECFKREKERAGHYLHASSEAKLLEKVQHELLTQYKQQLGKKASSSFHALLRDDNVKDLSRMYKIFCKIPKGLEHFATMFRRRVTDVGTTLVKEAEDAASNRRAEKKERDGGEEQAFVGKIIELHDKYLQYVSQCFLNHYLFQKALKEAFEVFCNKSIAGSTSAEFLATFYDKILKNGGSERLSEEAVEDTLEKIAKIFSFISDKDLFAELHRKKLASRLLSNTSANDDHERCVLTMLKQQCGGQFTSKMEGMVIDLPLARESQTSFEEHLKGNSTSSLGIDFAVKVLNARYWPPYKYSDLALPAQMMKCVEVYNEYYQTQNRQRKLTWIYSLGTCNMTVHFDSKSIELIVTTYQAAVLLLFNAGDKLSYAEIKVQLNLADEDIVRLLYSLSCAKYKILTTDTNTKTVTPADSFSFNAAFTDKMRRITIPPPPMDEKKRVTEVVVKDRRYAIDASIVRILKSHKVLPFQQLLVQCMEQLSQMFKPDVKDIKKRTEDLIGREFLERDKENPNTLRYLA